MTAAPELAAGVRPVDAWLYVEASDPDLISTWRQARADFDVHEGPLQARAAAFQRDRNIPRRRVPTPHGRALQEAEAAVAEALEGMITSGAIVYAGFLQGQLDGAPEPIPLALLGARRPRGTQVTVRGVTFHDVRLHRAAALAGAEPEAA